MCSFALAAHKVNLVTVFQRWAYHTSEFDRDPYSFGPYLSHLMFLNQMQ